MPRNLPTRGEEGRQAQVFAVKRVVVLGEALFDVYASGAIEGDAIQSRSRPRRLTLDALPGGAPCNVAAWLAELGIPVALVGGFADDLLGEALRAELRERAIDLSYSVTLAGTRTPLALVMTGPGGERAFRLYLKGTPVEQLQPSDLREGLLDGAAWFHFGGVLPAFPKGLELTAFLVQEAKRRSLLTSCDINVRPDVWAEGGVPFSEFLEVLAGVDLLKVSSEDLEWMRAETNGTLTSPEDLLSFGGRLIAFTQGSDGATLLTPQAHLHIEPPRCSVVDTTGAGDAFTAGLIGSMVRMGAAKGGDSLPITPELLAKAGEFATAIAGRALSQRGAMPAD